MASKTRTVDVHVDSMHDGRQEQTIDTREFAELLATDWSENRSRWRVLSQGKTWQPTDEVYLAILKKTKYQSWRGASTGSPQVELFVRKERLFAVKWYFGSLTANNNDSRGWEFVYRAAKEAPLIAVEYDYALVDQALGTITAPYSKCFLFSPQDPLWPWPIFLPAKFSPWGKLADVVTPIEGSPLTGLLASKKDPLVRMAAVQLRDTIKQIVEEWGLQILNEL